MKLPFNLTQLNGILIVVALVIVIFNDTLLDNQYFTQINTMLENDVVFVIVIGSLIYYYTLDSVSALVLAFIFIYVITYKEKAQSINNVVKTLEAFGV
jgi:hypothetical protein